MPGGVTWQVDPGLAPSTPAKKPPPKKKPAAPAKKPTPPVRQPKYVKAGGLHSNPVAQAKGKGSAFGGLVHAGADTFADAVRTGYHKAVVPAVTPLIHDWNAVRPYTPAPTVERVAKATLPTAGGLISKTGHVADQATAAAILNTVHAPQDLYNLARHPLTPQKMRAQETTGELAASISKPSVPHYKIGHAELSAPYQQYFAGQQHVSKDELAQATEKFAQTPGAEVKGVPWPLSREATMADLKKIKANGWDLKDADHWTFDDFVSKYINKNEKTPFGFVRNTVGGLTQLAGIPSAMVQMGGAAVAAGGGNVKPGEDIAKGMLQYTKDSNPLDPEAWYKNAPAVLANLLPALKGASVLGGRAVLAEGERSIRIPETEGVPGSGGRYPQHVPADLIQRALFETKKALAQNPRSGALGAPGRRVQTSLEAQHLRQVMALSELARDARMKPAIDQLHKEIRDTANRTKGGRGAGPLTTLVQPGRHLGGPTRAVAIIEQARTGMTAEDLSTWRRHLESDWQESSKQSTAKAEQYREEQQIALEEGHHKAAEEYRVKAEQMEKAARAADIAAENNRVIANLHETNHTVGPEHSLVQALVKASDLASDFRQEMSQRSPDGDIVRGLTDRAKRFGNLESRLRAGRRDLQDPALHERARSEDTEISFHAQQRLRHAEEADAILRSRERYGELKDQAKQRRGGEDAAGRSHAEREALGGVSELERVSERQVHHLDTESRAMVEPRERLARRTEKVQEPTGRPTVTTEPHPDLARHEGYVQHIEQRLAEHDASAPPEEISAPRRAPARRDEQTAELEGRRAELQDTIDDPSISSQKRAALKRRAAKMDAELERSTAQSERLRGEDLDAISKRLKTGDSDLKAHPQAHIIPWLKKAKQLGIPARDAFAAFARKSGLSHDELVKVLKDANAAQLRVHHGVRDVLTSDLEKAQAHVDHLRGKRTRVETPAEAPKPRHPIEANPHGEHEGLAPSEHEKIKAKLGDIAERHINRERAANLKKHKERIAQIDRELGAQDLSPEMRDAWQKRKDAAIEKFNTPSPRVMRRIEVSIDAYLKSWGKRLTEREKRTYREEVIKRTARITQSRGDLRASARRERLQETRAVRERERSSGELEKQAALEGANYDALMESYERIHGRGAHMDLVHEEVKPQGFMGYARGKGRGLRPRTRATRITKSEGIQTTRGAYSPEATARQMVSTLRSLADDLYSTKLYDSLLDTSLVRPADNMAFKPTPEGWHWVSADNLMKWTSHPLHTDSSALVSELVDAGGASVKGGIWKGMLQELHDTSSKPQALIPDEPGFLIRDSALQELEQMLRKHDSGDFGIFTELTNQYRKLLLFTLPRTFTNNMIGNIGLALLSGASMMDIVRAAHILRNHPEVLPSLIRNRGLVASQFGPDASLGGWMDMWRRANTFAEDLGQAATYVAQVRGYGKARGLKARGKNGILAGMDDVSSEWHKVMTALAKGEDPNVIPLMQKSKHFFGDLSKQTSVNKVLSTSVLFHRWLGHIIRLITVTLPTKYPGRFALMIRMGQLGDDYRKRHGVLPDWAAGVVRLALEHVKMPDGTIQNVILGLSTTGTNPAQSLDQVADLGSESNPVFPGLAATGGALSPVVSVPLQVATGINLQTGRRFRDRYGNEIGPDEMLSLAGHLAWANAPVLSTGLSTAGTSGDSQIWDQAPAATSPAAFRRQLGNPAAIHATSPQSNWAILLRALGVPITRLDSYGERYNQHLSSLVYALEQDAKDKQNEHLSAKPQTPVAPAGPAPKPTKPLTPEQVKAKQKKYAEQVKKRQGAGGKNSILAKQKAYAEKVKNGG